MLPADNAPKKQVQPSKQIADVLADFEAKSNIVGLYDLLLKIDRRINPKNSDASENPKKYD